MATAVLLACACSDDTKTGDESGTTDTSESTSDETDSSSGTTSETDTGDGDGDGDGDPGDGDGDGDTGDGDGDTGDGDGDGDGDGEFCGNGNVEAGEDCDDQNQDDVDGCNQDCRFGPTSLLSLEYNTCATVGQSGIRCWGNGGALQGYGQLSSSAIGDDETPAEFYADAPNDGDIELGLDAAVLELSGGSNHACARFEGGVVRCWGAGNWGQLGYENGDHVGGSETPFEYYAGLDGEGSVELGGAAMRLVSGAGHNCVLIGGAVRCWGGNGNGVLGYGNTSDLGLAPGDMPPSDVMLGGDVDEIDAGYAHTCAVMATGAVRCWGNCAVWNCGYGQSVDNDGNIGGDETPANFYAGEANGGDIQVGAGQVEQLASGNFFTCARFVAGAVRCWGMGDDGQLGYGATAHVGENETPAAYYAGVPDDGEVEIGGAALEISAGTAHVCALLVGGAVRCWGLNDVGQLGYGTTDSVGDDETPAEYYAGLDGGGDVPLSDEAVAIAAGGKHTCALLVDGSIECWGRGRFVELGHGDCVPSAPWTQCDVGDEGMELPPPKTLVIP